MFCLQGGLSEGIPFVPHGLPQQRWEQQGNVEKAPGQGGPTVRAGPSTPGWESAGTCTSSEGG